VTSDLDEVTAGVLSGTDDVVDRILAFVASVFPSLTEARSRRMHRDGAAVGHYYAIRLLTGAPERASHHGFSKSADLIGVAKQASIGAGRLAGECRRLLWLPFRVRLTDGLRVRQPSGNAEDEGKDSD